MTHQQVEGDINSLNTYNAEVTGRTEDYVKNYLIFGIEEINGARNTDSMIVVSINTKDDSIKLTSLMRDSYVEIPGYKANKLNSAYARGGAALLIQTIENNYKIHLEGYAHVHFESFEAIIDRIGGLEIELGKKEAAYLRKTNYISNPEYRTVTEGINLMNGNQVLGYCRVRKVATLGGVNNDYGRTLRHRRVINAAFEKLKDIGILKAMPIVKDCMGLVTTNLTKEQITKAIEAIVENKITTMNMMRLPADGMFNDPKSYNGVTYPLVYDWDKNLKAMNDFIFNESKTTETSTDD